MSESQYPKTKTFKITIIIGYTIFLLALFEGAGRFTSLIVREIYNKEVTLTSQDRDLIKSIVQGGKRYITYDPELGWVSGRNIKAELYESNSLGARSTKEYTIKSQNPGFTRILAFGDSFTHSDDVPNKDAWTTILENNNKNLEVLNYGVPAYGIDQAFLRFQRESEGAIADVVLMGMMSENVYRHINTFRKFYQQTGGFPLGKPRFIEEGSSSVKLIPNWFSSAEKYHSLLESPSAKLREAGVNDYYFNNKPPTDDCGILRLPCALELAGWLIREKIDRGQKDPWSGFLHYDMKTEGPRLTAKITRAFAKAVATKGMRPILVLFPNKTDYFQYKLTRTKNYDPIMTKSIEYGIETWDAMEAFTEGGRLFPFEEVFTKSSGHYSAEGNKHIANWLSEKLHLNKKQQY